MPDYRGLVRLHHIPNGNSEMTTESSSREDLTAKANADSGVHATPHDAAILELEVDQFVRGRKWSYIGLGGTALLSVCGVAWTVEAGASLFFSLVAFTLCFLGTGFFFIPYTFALPFAWDKQPTLNNLRRERAKDAATMAAYRAEIALIRSQATNPGAK